MKLNDITTIVIERNAAVMQIKREKIKNFR